MGDEGGPPVGQPTLIVATPSSVPRQERVGRADRGFGQGEVGAVG